MLRIIEVWITEDKKCIMGLRIPRTLPHRTKLKYNHHHKLVCERVLGRCDIGKRTYMGRRIYLQLGATRF